MKYWVLLCLTFGFFINNEAVGWVCLLLAVMPPLFRLFYKYAKVVDRETRRVGPCIDEEGFYE